MKTLGLFCVIIALVGCGETNPIVETLTCAAAFYRYSSTLYKDGYRDTMASVYETTNSIHNIDGTVKVTIAGQGSWTFALISTTRAKVTDQNANVLEFSESECGK